MNAIVRCDASKLCRKVEQIAESVHELDSLGFQIVVPDLNELMETLVRMYPPELTVETK